MCSESARKRLGRRTCPREDASVGDWLFDAIHKELRLRRTRHVEGQHLAGEGVVVRFEGVGCRV